MPEPNVHLSKPSGPHRWVCPECGWVGVTNDSRPLDEQRRIVADGWWWCAQRHPKVALVLDEPEATQ